MLHIKPLCPYQIHAISKWFGSVRTEKGVLLRREVDETPMVTVNSTWDICEFELIEVWVMILTSNIPYIKYFPLPKLKMIWTLSAYNFLWKNFAWNINLANFCVKKFNKLKYLSNSYKMFKSILSFKKKKLFLASYKLKVFEFLGIN